MNNVGVIDTFLNTFTTYINSGFGLIKGEVGYLASTLIVIDITLAGLFWAWGVDEDILQRLVKKTLYVGVFAFLITNFNNLSGLARLRQLVWIYTIFGAVLGSNALFLCRRGVEKGL